MDQVQDFKRVYPEFAGPFSEIKPGMAKKSEGAKDAGGLCGYEQDAVKRLILIVEEMLYELVYVRHMMDSEYVHDRASCLESVANVNLLTDGLVGVIQNVWPEIQLLEDGGIYSVDYTQDSELIVQG